MKEELRTARIQQSHDASATGLITDQLRSQLRESEQIMQNQDERGRSMEKQAQDSWRRMADVEQTAENATNTIQRLRT